MTLAYIALGSNLDGPARQLQQAVDALQALPGTSIEKVSSVYRSAAVGPGEQPDYLNAVLSVTTDSSPQQLLKQLQSIETAQGRVRAERWGARTLDLDILLYNQQSIKTETLEIPHPAMKDRHFVLYPLAEIAGRDLILPGGNTLASALEQCPMTGLVPTDTQLLHCNPKIEEQQVDAR